MIPFSSNNDFDKVCTEKFADLHSISKKTAWHIQTSKIIRLFVHITEQMIFKKSRVLSHVHVIALNF